MATPCHSFAAKYRAELPSEREAGLQNHLQASFGIGLSHIISSASSARMITALRVPRSSFAPEAISFQTPTTFMAAFWAKALSRWLSFSEVFRSWRWVQWAPFIYAVVEKAIMVRPELKCRLAKSSNHRVAATIG